MRKLNLLLVALSLLGFIKVHAWQKNGVVICDAYDSQDDPKIITDGSGGAIITWQDWRGDDIDIYAQRINSLGVVQWTTNGVVICDTTDDLGLPEIISDGSGGAIITWQDWRGDDIDIYAQRINSSGVVQWTTNGVVICDTINIQVGPQIISDGSGGAIITWRDDRGYDEDIYAQRINSSGVIQWNSNGVMICDAIDWQQDPEIISDGSGGAIITWEDERSGPFSNIYAQRINSSGVVQWDSNGVMICDAPVWQEYPEITSDGSGGAIITWQDSRGDYDIYAQRINSSGVVQWDSNGVVICDAPLWQEHPEIISDGSNGAIITWVDHRGDDDDIYAQRINSSGVVQWDSNDVVICVAPVYQLYPEITSDGSNGAIITWEDSRDFGDYDIYAQRINSSGVVQWDSNGVVICDAPSDEAQPEITSDGSGGAIITWVDWRGDDEDIYAQRVNSAGSVVLEEAFVNLKSLLPVIKITPNPTKRDVSIVYQIPDVGIEFTSVRLKIYNLAGQLVKTLINEVKKPGAYTVSWDGRNDNGEELISGIYFCRLEIGDIKTAKKLLLMK